MFHSPDYLPHNCALKSLEGWREITRLLDLFLVIYFLYSRSLKCFTAGTILEMELFVVSKPGIHAPMVWAILEDT